MQDLQNAIAASFDKIASAGKIEEMIEKQLTETIGGIIKDSLRSYSDFGKALEEKVKAAVNVDLRNLELPGYNDVILKIIERQVAGQLEGSIAKNVEKQISELLAPPPAEIKLSELLNEFIKSKSQDAACLCYGRERISLHIERSDAVAGYVGIYFDEKDGVSKYSCNIQLNVTDDGSVFGIKINEHDPKKTLFVGPLFGFERRLFQLYAAGTKLIVDGDSEDDFDTHYPGNDY
jgi:hypothetical protein